MSDINLNDQYPKTVTLPDGAIVEIRLMNATDRDAMLAFAQALPQEDLLFLRLDLTEPSVIDDWVHNIETGHSTSIVAYDNTGVIGYATVHRNPTPWTRRMGELRVNVSQNYRARGLGKNLTSEIFDIARGIGVKKLMANMTADQHGAQAAFRRLGFVPEAMLADYVEDRNGVSRDLVIMSYDMEGHLDQVADIVKI
ncbi:MAG: GNAT family N-acetyltransferase [Pseudomonadales bacterium]|nr:GNAT family N-acetyltransferase [Pseudomonadales bacterium]MDG1444236.1 GNAT family N-acetyltransferase [Pseudomonadales bacterium]